VVGLLVHHAAESTKPAPPVRSAVTVSASPAIRDPAGVCSALVAALPTTLSGRVSRPVTGVPAGTAAAWGDPPIVLRCGVPPPASYVPGTPVISVQGVDFDTYPIGGQIRWTAVGRRAYVQILIPNTIEGQGALIADIAPVIAAHDPAP